MQDIEIYQAIGRLEGKCDAIQHDIGRILDVLKEIPKLKTDVAALQEWRMGVDEHISTRRDNLQAVGLEIIKFGFVLAAGYCLHKFGG